MRTEAGIAVADHIGILAEPVRHTVGGGDQAAEIAEYVELRLRRQRQAGKQATGDAAGAKRRLRHVTHTPMAEGIGRNEATAGREEGCSEGRHVNVVCA